jgi:hypothetical protein
MQRRLDPGFVALEELVAALTQGIPEQNRSLREIDRIGPGAPRCELHRIENRGCGRANASRDCVAHPLPKPSLGVFQAMVQEAQDFHCDLVIACWLGNSNLVHLEPPQAKRLNLA